MTWIKGVTIGLKQRTQTGNDEFNRPVYLDVWEKVDNVLIEPVNQDDVTNVTNLSGKKEVYRLCIPKGDLHVWHDTEVIFYGHKYKTYGPVLEWIDDMVPLEWNRKVMVERYVQRKNSSE